MQYSKQTYPSVFLSVVTLRLKLQIKLRSCPLESIYCLKKCPGVHSTLDKCYYSVNKTQFLQNMLDDLNIILYNSLKCSIQNKHTLLIFFKFVIALKLKLHMKLCSCPLESMHCLKKCPGVHSTLGKCYYSVPSTNTISA